MIRTQREGQIQFLTTFSIQQRSPRGSSRIAQSRTHTCTNSRTQDVKRRTSLSLPVWVSRGRNDILFRMNNCLAGSNDISSVYARYGEKNVCAEIGYCLL